MMHSNPTDMTSGAPAAADAVAAADAAADSDTLFQLVDEIIDDLSMEVVFSCHMEAKMGVLFLQEELIASEADQLHHQGVGDRSSSDSEPPLFGQLLAAPSGVTKKPVMCRCPNCNRSMAALRFAPHLEKCMGMGRVSSRVASRRIAIQHRYSDDSDSDDHHQPPVKQRRSMKRSSTAPGNVAHPPPPPPPPMFHAAASSGVVIVEDDWEGLSTPSPSSVSTGSSGNSGVAVGGLGKVAAGQHHQHHQGSHNHHSRR